MKRHPRCVRLIQKKNKKGMDKKFGEDPYKSDEKDPLVARALQSSLWELEIILKSESDLQVKTWA